MKEISKKQIPREKCMRLLPKAPQTGLGLVDGVRGGPCVLSVMAFGRWDWGGGEDRVWVRMLLWIGGGGGRRFKAGFSGRGCACGWVGGAVSRVKRLGWRAWVVALAARWNCVVSPQIHPVPLSPRLRVHGSDVSRSTVP